MVSTVATAIPDLLQRIGPFRPIQVVASADLHELLTDPVNMASGAAGALTYHGGPTIVGGKFFNVHLGAPDYNVADFDAFTAAICANGFYLSPDSKDASPCAFLGSKTVNPSPFPATVDDAAIQAWVDGFVSQEPGHDANTMIAIIFPAGSAVTFGGQGSCAAFCGYHSMTAAGNYYQVICDPSCAGCHGSFTPDQARMMIQSHEYGEWRSDPQGTAWYNDQTGMENGDECAWNLVPWGPSNQWAVQPLAVNGQGCYVGPYTAAPSPPPPPPPAPGPATSSMAMNLQPQGGGLGSQLPDFSVKLLDGSGALNTADNSTVVTSSVLDSTGLVYSNVQAVKAQQGICLFKGDTFHHALTFHYHFTAPALTAIDSAPFTIGQAPPPPPPVTGKYSAVITAPDKTTHQLQEV